MFIPRRKRKPGAQLGNQTCPERSRRNARKHGAYSKILSPEEQRLLTIASIPGIDAEIALIRTRIRFLIQQEHCPMAPLVRMMESLCRVIRLKSNLASLGELQSFADYQLTALENLSRATSRERLESKKPVAKLVDASQKSF